VALARSGGKALIVVDATAGSRPNVPASGTRGTSSVGATCSMRDGSDPDGTACRRASPRQRRLAITANHNPIEWNALKFIGPSGLFLDGARRGGDATVVEGNIPRATWDKLGTITRTGTPPPSISRKILALPTSRRRRHQEEGIQSRARLRSRAGGYSCRCSRAAGMQARDDQHGARWPLSQVPEP